uniref:FAM69 protein-kinase domain-containing protein n=1 Tax=Parascaris univalens TaxID=6257 RepID=A0A914ZYI1_PARUN
MRMWIQRTKRVMWICRLFGTQPSWTPNLMGFFFFIAASLSLCYLSFIRRIEPYVPAPSSTTVMVDNATRSETLLLALCDAYEAYELSGDMCHRLCHSRNWSFISLHQDGGIGIIMRIDDQKITLKSQYATIDQFDEVEPDGSEEEFTNAVVAVINKSLMLGWSSHHKRQLIELIWPRYQRKRRAPLSKADRRSVWTLSSQQEYVNLRLLPLSGVTRKVVGTCGHFYQVEPLVGFHLSKYLLRLRKNILFHLMGTLKLLDAFLNEPLQMCDLRFDNLGLSADYPKRFMVLDASKLYTQSRLNALLTTRSCTNDTDCPILDCLSQCDLTTGYCTGRINHNVQVFCTNLLPQLFGNNWSRSDKYLAVCDTSVPFEQRILQLRLNWAWLLPEV